MNKLKRIFRTKINKLKRIFRTKINKLKRIFMSRDFRKILKKYKHIYYKSINNKNPTIYSTSYTCETFWFLDSNGWENICYHKETNRLAHIYVDEYKIPHIDWLEI